MTMRRRVRAQQSSDQAAGLPSLSLPLQTITLHSCSVEGDVCSGSNKNIGMHSVEFATVEPGPDEVPPG